MVKIFPISDSEVEGIKRSVGKPLDNDLEISIGKEIHHYRKLHNLTVVQLANQSGLSPGMLSKIERGLTSSSLNTIRAIANGLNVPVTALFQKFEEKSGATASHVKAGQGILIDRRGTNAGHQYQLLGHSIKGKYSVEPYLITLTVESDAFPVFQHEGVEFMYILSGKMRYRHASKSYDLEPGDSLFFDSDALHGPEEFISLPIQFITVIVQQNFV